MATRIHYLDGIKVFLSFMVIAHHAGQSYGDTGGAWLLFDTQKVSGMRHFFFLNASYLMSFYFFISGYFTYTSLLRKSKIEFIKDRFMRLGLPLFIISAFIFIPLHYFLSQPDLPYLPFAWELYFDKPPLALGHLWFIASLLFYSLLFAFVFYLKAPSEVKVVYKNWFPLVYILITAVGSYIIRTIYVVDEWVTWIIPIEPAHLPIYIISFYVGILAKKNEWLASIRLQNTLPYMLLLVVFVVMQNTMTIIDDALVFEVIYESLICVGVSLSLLAFFKTFLNADRGIIQNISENNYGIYLFHLFFVLFFQYLFLSTHLPGIIKFLFVTFLAFTSSWMFSYAIRKLPSVGRII